MRLPRSFFARPTLRVARSLLGCVLSVRQGGRLRRAVIVETEAYVGPGDLASHASRGRTKRTEVMFGRPGCLYVYLIYGMYHCVNVVTERVGYPAAVLIRAVIPLPRRTQPKVVAGPGRVCRYFGIDRRFNTEDTATSRRGWFSRGLRLPPGQVTARTRVGVDYAGPWQHKLWRFALTPDGVRR